MRPELPSSESWTASELFSHCEEMSAEEREALLARVAETRPEVAAQVRKLLRVHDEGAGFLDRPAIEHVSQTPFVETPPEAPPRGVAHWIRSRPRPFWIFLAIDAIAIFFYIFVAINVARYGRNTVDWGYDLDLIGGKVWRVSSIDNPGPAVGKLEIGDEVVAFGDATMSPTKVIAGLYSQRPDEPYRIRVSRKGAMQDLTLRLSVKPAERPLGDVLTFGIVSLAFFFTAVLLGFLRSGQRIAQRAYAALITEGLVLAKALLAPYHNFLSGSPLSIFEGFQMLDGIHFGFAYLFYCTLFDRIPNTRRWLYPMWAVFGCGAWIAAIRIALEYGRSSAVLDANPRLFVAVWSLDPLFYILAPITVCVVIARNYFKAREPEDRRRARWITFGSLAGILPYVFVKLIGGMLSTWSTPLPAVAEVYQDLRRLSILAAIVIPMATGYAIYKHRLFDIRVVVRRGVRYALAKSVLQMVLALPAIGLVIALVRNAHRTVADAVWNNFGFIVLLALLAAVLRFRVPLRRWLDQRFFRESYRQERILLSLIDSVQNLQSLEKMAETVGASIDAAFHPERLMILFRSGRDRFFTSAYSTADGDFRIRENSPLLAMLEGDIEARQLSTIQGIPQEELRRFETLGIDLVVPMAGRARGVAGVILLGRKRAEEPYTREDRRLLAALGAQMAMVCENTSLQQMLTDQQRTAEDIRARLEDAGVDAFRECPECGRCYDLAVRQCPADGARPVFSLPVKRTVDRYRLERLIGKGGMGAVYEAEDLALRRRVAIKIMTGAAMDNPTAVQRIYREARAVARLNHPNIIVTYDFGHSEGVAFLVMELVAGETLRSMMNRGGIEPAEAAAWFDQLLAGVEAAHQAGVIHRDLKPENILIAASPDGNPLVKILDFGIAKTQTTETSASITRAGTVLGSMQYMSPEQFNGARVDPRSDVFSIGVILYELLTGALPFSGDTYTERIISVLHDEVVFPDATDPRLEALLKRCLAKNPADRPASAAEMRDALGPLLSGRLSAGQR